MSDPGGISLVTHALTLVTRSSIFILNVTSPMKLICLPFASSMPTGPGYVMMSIEPKWSWISSNTSAFALDVSNLALNLSGVLPDEGRGWMRTVVGIVILLRPSFFIVGE